MDTTAATSASDDGVTWTQADFVKAQEVFVQSSLRGYQLIGYWRSERDSEDSIGDTGMAHDLRVHLTMPSSTLVRIVVV
jgi:hypothetical protein